MVPILLEDKQIARRTLGHDMESIFSVIVWIATLDYHDELSFLAKPLAESLLDKRKTSRDIVNVKTSWFEIERRFQEEIIEHFEPVYHEDRFVACLSKLHQILYQNGGNDSEDDPMKEGVF